MGPIRIPGVSPQSRVTDRGGPGKRRAPRRIARRVPSHLPKGPPVPKGSERHMAPSQRPSVPPANKVQDSSGPRGGTDGSGGVRTAHGSAQAHRRVTPGPHAWENGNSAQHPTPWHTWPRPLLPQSVRGRVGALPYGGVRAQASPPGPPPVRGDDPDISGPPRVPVSVSTTATRPASSPRGPSDPVASSGPSPTPPSPPIPHLAHRHAGHLGRPPPPPRVPCLPKGPFLSAPRCRRPT